MSEEQKQSSDDLFILAIDLWCEQYHPSSSLENAQTMSMQEILEALDSLYVTDSFSGSIVFAELKKRGYITKYDAACNQFKILVNNL